MTSNPMENTHPEAPVRRLCTARNRSGNPCGRYPVPGTNVCPMHGGSAPQVKRKAALRLLELVDPAIATLAREMARADKSADRQRAANSILDRAGVSRQVQTPDGDLAKALLVERLVALRDSRSVHEAVEDTYHEVVAGYTVDPDDPHPEHDE